MNWKLYEGDCLEVMKEIPDHSVDMILADLPYGTTACKWDTIIPFEPLWEQYKRLIKPGRAIVLFGSEPFSSYLRMSNIKDYKYDWVWKKSRPGGAFDAKNKPMKNHELISIFSDGSIPTNSNLKMLYNPQGVTSCHKVIKTDKQNRANYGGNRPGLKEYHTQTQTGYPTSVLDFASEGKTVHPTQKPVALCEYLIKTYTNEGDTVLDNVAGSGTTGVAAINTGRKTILIEKDPGYCEIIRQRLG